MPVLTRSQAKNNSVYKYAAAAAEISQDKKKPKVNSAETTCELRDWFKIYIGKMIHNFEDDSLIRAEKLRLANEMFFIIDEYIYDVLVASKNSAKFKLWVKFAITVYNKSIEFESILADKKINTTEYAHYMNFKACAKAFRKNMLETFRKKLDLCVNLGDWIYRYYYILDVEER